jgi:hypothetical protein
MRISSLLWPALLVAIAAAASLVSGFSLSSWAIFVPAVFFFYPETLTSWLLVLAIGAFAYAMPQLPTLLGIVLVGVLAERTIFAATNFL